MPTSFEKSPPNRKRVANDRRNCSSSAYYQEARFEIEKDPKEEFYFPRTFLRDTQPYSSVKKPGEIAITENSAGRDCDTLYPRCTVVWKFTQKNLPIDERIHHD